MTWPSSSSCYYHIDQVSYRRNTARERRFKSEYLLRLLKAFDCRCAWCSADDNGLELDHFFVPKCEGGEWILKEKTEAGGMVKRLNAMPLCSSCNRKKRERPASKIMSEDAIQRMWMKALVLDAEIGGVDPWLRMPIVASWLEEQESSLWVIVRTVPKAPPEKLIATHRDELVRTAASSFLEASSQEDRDEAARWINSLVDGRSSEHRKAVNQYLKNGIRPDTW